MCTTAGLKGESANSIIEYPNMPATREDRERTSNSALPEATEDSSAGSFIESGTSKFADPDGSGSGGGWYMD